MGGVCLMVWRPEPGVWPTEVLELVLAPAPIIVAQTPFIEPDEWRQAVAVMECFELSVLFLA